MAVSESCTWHFYIDCSRAHCPMSVEWLIVFSSRSHRIRISHWHLSLFAFIRFHAWILSMKRMDVLKRLRRRNEQRKTARFSHGKCCTTRMQSICVANRRSQGTQFKSFDFSELDNECRFSLVIERCSVIMHCNLQHIRTISTLVLFQNCFFFFLFLSPFLWIVNQNQWAHIRSFDGINTEWRRIDEKKTGKNADDKEMGKYFFMGFDSADCNHFFKMPCGPVTELKSMLVHLRRLFRFLSSHFYLDPSMACTVYFCFFFFFFNL